MRKAQIITLFILSMATVASFMGGCTDKPHVDNRPAGFRVSFVGSPTLGTVTSPLPFSLANKQAFNVKIEALLDKDRVDTSYNGEVVVRVAPTGKLDVSPMTVKLSAGVADNVPVSFLGAFGIVRVVVSDSGYVKAASPSSAICNNMSDDNQNGFADMKDRGCYAGDDDTETGGNGASGMSAPMFFANPRIEDIAKPLALDKKGASGLVGSRVSVDRGFMLVSRVGTDGLYVTDYDGAKWDGSKFILDPLMLSYKSVFAYNFSTPLNISEGDCLVQIDGTVEEFYGYTELGKPTWKKGNYQFCSQLMRSIGFTEAECPLERNESTELQVQECYKKMGQLGNTPVEITTMVISDPQGNQLSVWDQTYQQTERFEAGLVQVADMEMFSEIRRCDRNGNATIDFSDQEEADCSDECGETPNCVVEETYNRYKQWTVTFIDGLNQPQKLAVTTVGSLPKFDPLLAAIPNFSLTEMEKNLKVVRDTAKHGPAKKLSKLVGTMRHLSFAKPPWILEPRKPADCTGCEN